MSNLPLRRRTPFILRGDTLKYANIQQVCVRSQLQHRKRIAGACNCQSIASNHQADSKLTTNSAKAPPLSDQRTLQRKIELEHLEQVEQEFTEFTARFEPKLPDVTSDAKLPPLPNSTATRLRVSEEWDFDTVRCAIAVLAWLHALFLIFFHEFLKSLAIQLPGLALSLLLGGERLSALWPLFLRVRSLQSVILEFRKMMCS